VLCAGLIVVVPAIYLPYALHNLPVAAHVDERTSLLVLKHFHDGSLNPQFFMYPMLYYYVTYFLTAAFPFSKVLLYGRLLNLSFVGLTAAIMYCLCERHLESRAAGVVAVLCIVSSTTITDSAAYICTDVLLAATSIAALFFPRGVLSLQRTSRVVGWDAPVDAPSAASTRRFCSLSPTA
jgi:hypothetical protein